MFYLVAMPLVILSIAGMITGLVIFEKEVHTIRKPIPTDTAEDYIMD